MSGTLVLSESKPAVRMAMRYSKLSYIIVNWRACMAGADVGVKGDLVEFVSFRRGRENLFTARAVC